MPRRPLCSFCFDLLKFRLGYARSRDRVRTKIKTVIKYCTVYRRQIAPSPAQRSGILPLSHSINHHRVQIAAYHEKNPRIKYSAPRGNHLLPLFNLSFPSFSTFPPRLSTQSTPKPIHKGPLRVGLDVIQKEGPTSRHFAPPRARVRSGAFDRSLSH